MLPQANMGSMVYRQTCARCHDQGIDGAQRIGDHEGWQARRQQGLELLVQNTIKGYSGAVGHMPPRGGNASLSDSDVRAAVIYLLEQSQ